MNSGIYLILLVITIVVELVRLDAFSKLWRARFDLSITINLVLFLLFVFTSIVNYFMIMAYLEILGMTNGLLMNIVVLALQALTLYSSINRKDA